VKTAGAEEWIVAQFSPVWLEALVGGSGTIDADGVRRTCTDDRCIMGLFKSGTRVTVTGRPTKTGAATRWGFGCDPYESDLSAGRCVVDMSNVRNFVSVGFDGSDPDPSPPFNLAVNLEVERGLFEPRTYVAFRQRIRTGSSRHFIAAGMSATFPALALDWLL
jgi:hypothetical protein